MCQACKVQELSKKKIKAPNILQRKLNLNMSSMKNDHVSYYQTNDPTVFEKLKKKKHLKYCGFNNSVLSFDEAHPNPNASSPPYPERHLFASKNDKIRQDPDLYFHKCKGKNLWLVCPVERIKEIVKKVFISELVNKRC
jgi:hypothetical protein